MSEQQRGRVRLGGRPSTTGTGQTVGVRLLPPVLSELDAWIARQPEPQPTRAEAVYERVVAHVGRERDPAGRPRRPRRTAKYAEPSEALHRDNCGGPDGRTGSARATDRQVAG